MIVGKIYYDCANDYIKQSNSIKEKISKIDSIIDGLLTNALENIGNSSINDYMLNDGQSIIKTTYRSLEEVNKAITGYNKLKQMYLMHLRSLNGFPCFNTTVFTTTKDISIT